MLGLREAGVIGGSIVLAGGVAYLIWNYASSSSGEETPKQDGKGARQEGDGDDEAEAEERGAAVAAAPLVAAEAQETSESRPVEPAGTQVLVLGLDGAGKTSLLHCLSTGTLEQDMQPTQGFNAVSIHKEELHLEFLEIGGKEDLRPYWEKYMSKALLLVFVVDSSSPQRFPLAKNHLHELLASHPRLPLMVLANKQDLPGACSITDLHDALALSTAGDRRLFLIGTHARKGEAELSAGVQDARELIMQLVCGGR